MCRAARCQDNVGPQELLKQWASVLLEAEAQHLRRVHVLGGRTPSHVRECDFVKMQPEAIDVEPLKTPVPPPLHLFALSVQNLAKLSLAFLELLNQLQKFCSRRRLLWTSA